MTSWQNRADFNRALARVSQAFSILIAAIAFALPNVATAGDVPTFAVDASWPKQLPNDWIIGQIGAKSDAAPVRAAMAVEKDELTKAYCVHALACLGDPEGRKLLATA